MTDHEPETRSPDRTENETIEETDRPAGVPIPDEHAGAFVAEVFEDVERSTSWTDVVDALVAPATRQQWDALSPREQVREVLGKAAAYDQQAIEILESIPLDSTVDVSEEVAEAKRCRNNADTFRDGIADAFANDHVDDDAIVDVVATPDFDTDRIARREELLERVASTHDFDFQPYGGTLVQDSDRETADPNGSEPW